MNLMRVIFSAFFCLLFSSIFVFAKEEKKEEEVSIESPYKQYIVTFHDEATEAEFSEISKWITDNNGNIKDFMNENFGKFIIAQSDTSILKLAELKPNIIESVEEDNLEWDDLDHHEEL